MHVDIALSLHEAMHIHPSGAAVVAYPQCPRFPLDISDSSTKHETTRRAVALGVLCNVDAWHSSR